MQCCRYNVEIKLDRVSVASHTCLVRRGATSKPANMKQKTQRLKKSAGASK